jgi:HSP20 family protein
MNRSLVTRGENPFYNLAKRFFDNDFDYYVPSLFESKGLSNVSENENEYLIEVSAPGFKKDDIKIEIQNDILRVYSNVENKKEEEKDGYFRREFYKSSFERNFSVPKDVNIEQISASMEDGILNVIIPKIKEEKKQNIEITIK